MKAKLYRASKSVSAYILCLIIITLIVSIPMRRMEVLRRRYHSLMVYRQNIQQQKRMGFGVSNQNVNPRGQGMKLE